ncbi:MAG: YkvA family protein [Acidobacteriota bacterium]
MLQLGKPAELIRKLKLDIYALFLAYRDPRVPWYAKAAAAVVLAYALSPIDLIPDFIPVLGYLDDLILIPVALALVIRLIPQDVFREYRMKAEAMEKRQAPKNLAGAIVIVGLWVLACYLVIKLALHFYH